MLRSFDPYKPPKKTVNVLLIGGGMGDHVGGSLIAVQYILKNYPWLRLNIYVPEYLYEFTKHVLTLNDGCTIRIVPKPGDKTYDRQLPTLTTGWDGRISPMKKHLTTYAFDVLVDEEVTLDKKNSLLLHRNLIDISSFNLPEHYAVIIPGFTVPVRELKPHIIEGISQFLKLRDITPVYLGQEVTQTGGQHLILSTHHVDLTLGLNLINQTTLLQSARIMSEATMVIGVDCGLLHVAAYSDVPIIAGYTTVAPNFRMPIRHDELGWRCVSITPEIQCRFCQSSTNFIYGHDYRRCIYKDTKCVEQLTLSKWTHAIETFQQQS